MQTHLGAHSIQRSGQEVSRSHPCFKCPIRMLHGLSTHPHDLGVTIQPLLHGLEYFFMLPAYNTSLLACRTLRFQGTCFALGASVTMQRQSTFFRYHAPDQIFNGRTLVFILFGCIVKILPSEKNFGPIAEVLRPRHLSRNACLVAQQNICALEIVHIRIGQ